MLLFRRSRSNGDRLTQCSSADAIAARTHKTTFSRRLSLSDIRHSFKYERLAITRYPRFDSFAEAFAGMSVIAIITDRRDHHPEWVNVHERVEIVLTAHDADGLSRRDAALSERIDDLDLLFGSDSPRPGLSPCSADGSVSPDVGAASCGQSFKVRPRRMNRVDTLRACETISRRGASVTDWCLFAIRIDCRPLLANHGL